MRVRTDGKFFERGGQRFDVRGVGYGTFRPRHDEARFPERDMVKADFASMAEAGFTVVRTYTPAPDDVVELATDWGLYLLQGVFWPDWRYMVGASRRETRRIAREAARTVRAEAKRVAREDHILALVLGNEIPADVVRWVGAPIVEGLVDELTEVVRGEDPDMLVTYATYPTTEYLRLDRADFLTCNVYLERPSDLRRYLTRLHHLAGDRPLVLGETGLHAGDGVEGSEGEFRQAQSIGWQLETALERGVAGTCIFSWTDEWWVGDAEVEGWHFGLTRADRSARPALQVACEWNHKTVRDLKPVEEWPRVSVVVCAYNAAGTLDECLQHAEALDYPNYEIIVVDDGSTDCTAGVAARHPDVRLVCIAHAGLSAARNEGLRAATGTIVAYLDSDAYPCPEWPYYLALGFDSATVGGVGGPNVPPRDDPFGAQQVAVAPGGPVHVLLSDDRAEHVPGCNMAFWKEVLEEIGGFDPVYTAAGDDVDACWKVLDRKWEIGFHPAALVWHHRRSGIRTYLRQQRGYGRAEALVEARHPDRFTSLGTARWRGLIYSFRPVSLTRPRIYRGEFGTAAYQSVYRGGGHGLDIAHQAGVPFALALLLTLPFALLSWTAAIPSGAAFVFLAALATIDLVRTQPPRRLGARSLRFRVGVTVMQLAQPVARSWSRWRIGAEARRGRGADHQLPAPVGTGPSGTLIYPATASRAEFAGAVVGALRRLGFRVSPVTGWEDHDGVIPASMLIEGVIVTSAFPEGCMQLRIRRRVRWLRLGAWAALAACVAGAAPALTVVALLAALADSSFGFTRCGRRLRRRLTPARDIAMPATSLSVAGEEEPIPVEARA